MKFVIVGAGAIGRIFGTLLSRGRHEVVFVETNPEIVATINEHGIGIMEIGMEDTDEVQLVPAKAVTDAKAIDSCDFLIMAVKSYNTLTAIKNVAHLVAANAPVLTIQTGLGNLEVMEKVVSRQDILGGLTFRAGTALGPGIVRSGGMGKTYLGELDGEITPRLEKLGAAFNECGIVTDLVRRIIGRIWCKAIVYAALNTVSAILRIKNGMLLDKMESVTLLKRLIDEGKMVAEANAIDLVYHDLYELLFDACKNTSDNLSPMLQDILNGKRTEIDNLNGALCRYGEEKGIKLPTHHTIIQIVKLVEKWGPNFDGLVKSG